MKPVGMQPGTPDWEDTLRTAIRGAADVLLIVSPDAQGSRSIKDVLRLAQMYQRPVYANSGGGIYNTGTLTLSNSTVSGNHAHIKPDILDHRITSAVRVPAGLMSVSKSTA